MDIRAFENLELIPMLLKKIETMEERLKKFTPPLTTKKEVAKFLDVTPRTINNYISNGYLKENYHFHRKSDKIIVFIEEAVLEFRDYLNKGIVK
ncbi:MAG: helix-turn-helix domain-containing protein [Sulfurimonas sp.]|nr:helix-turn-helix domain-containing protein [Sulfurimonas sp.]